MGFQIPEYRLVWPATSRWHGLEVVLKDLSFEELETISSVRLADDTTDEGRKRTKEVLDILQSSLLSWNLDDRKGNPVPITEFHKQGIPLLQAIVMAWVSAVGEVSAPLEPNSSDGKASEEALIPMVVPSASHSS